MSVEFEDQDLSGAVFWGVYLRNARFRDVDFTGVRTHHVLLRDVEFDGPIDHLVVNGVDVTDYVNQHDPWQPLRGMAEPARPRVFGRSWAAFTSAWDDLISEVAALPPLEATVSVDGEWSFVQTLRHLLFVADKWILGPMTDRAWSPLGLPNSGSADHDWPDIDPTPIRPSTRCSPSGPISRLRCRRSPPPSTVGGWPTPSPSWRTARSQSWTAGTPSSRSPSSTSATPDATSTNSTAEAVDVGAPAGRHVGQPRRRSGCWLRHRRPNDVGDGLG